MAKNWLDSKDVEAEESTIQQEKCQQAEPRQAARIPNHVHWMPKQWDPLRGTSEIHKQTVKALAFQLHCVHKWPNVYQAPPAAVQREG